MSDGDLNQQAVAANVTTDNAQQGIEAIEELTHLSDREWFSTLTEEDRLKALSLRNYDFLVTLVRATQSVSVGDGEPTTARQGNIGIPSVIPANIIQDTIIKEPPVKKPHEKSEQTLSMPSKPLTAEKQDSNMTSTERDQIDDASPDILHETSAVDIDSKNSDAFRIRSSVDEADDVDSLQLKSQSDKEVFEVTGGDSNAAIIQEDISLSGNKNEQVVELEQIKGLDTDSIMRLFRLVDGSSSNDAPSTNEDLVAQLDSLSPLGKFLVSTPSYNSFQNAAQSLLDSKNNDSAPKGLPLSVLLILQLEFAVKEARALAMKTASNKKNLIKEDPTANQIDLAASQSDQSARREVGNNTQINTPEVVTEDEDTKKEVSFTTLPVEDISTKVPEEKQTGKDEIEGVSTVMESKPLIETSPQISENKVSKRKKKRRKRKASASRAKEVAEAKELSTVDTASIVESPASKDSEAISGENILIGEGTGKAVPILNEQTEANDEAHSKESVIENKLSPSRRLNRWADDSDDDDDSTVDFNPQGNNEKPKKTSTEDGLNVSRVNGVGTVFVTQSIFGDSITENRGDPKNGKERSLPLPEDNSDEWETVEAKPRSSRKKSGDRNNSNGRFSSLQSQHGNSQKKKAPRSAEARKRNQKRKMVRDILSSVIDNVHEEVTLKRNQRKQTSESSAPRPVPNAWGTSQSKKKQAPSTGQTTIGQKNYVASRSQDRASKSTMRDILVGNKKSGSNSNSVLQQATKRGSVERTRQVTPVTGERKNGDKAAKTAANADQNTAATLPETVSAVSNSSGITDRRLSKSAQKVPGLTVSESSSNESVEASKPQTKLQQGKKESNASPPLPTLLSAGNSNSANSSVASSLEAPHLAHHNHHSFIGNENDVGYHLLRVCDKLTRDIGNFMSRRKEALTIRRYERKLVLSALQDSLTSIWPAACQVQMYGSCATDLDLPSSDLDIVICGLDQSEQDAVTAASLAAAKNDREMTTNGTKNSSTQQTQYGANFAKLKSTNAERVMKLALELERQPWAVHVKAIPTATVPVIKILADPARLQSSENGEWLVQEPQTNVSTNSNDGADGRSQQRGSTNPMPWRGADVVNGLLSVDITFEGPEHGGIGSTTFSNRVVEEFSQESGLQSEQTAPVQVLMVLKELLAQRRLNEPFSGGLSSYALLLLVISVVRERKIIRTELERLEHQRKVVAAGGGNAIAREEELRKATNNGKQTNAAMADTVNPGPAVNMIEPKQENYLAASEKPKSSNIMGKSGATKQSQSTKSSGTSSWASIAKTTSTSTVKTAAESSRRKTKGIPPPKKSGSFADAVAKGGSKSTTNSSDNKKGTSKKEEAKSQSYVDGAKAENIEKPTNDVAKTSSLPVSAPVFEPGASPSHNGSAQPQQNGPPIDDSGTFFPQSFHDVIEVLCSGETTPGKLLMHFLIFYGQHFDAMSTAIDYSNTHTRDFNGNNGYAISSPYMHRRNTGNYDPMTGMFTVDPIVIYDPLIGAESNNVARSCFAWSSIRWVFVQSYMTLSSAVEMSAGHSSVDTVTDSSPPTSTDTSIKEEGSWKPSYRHDESGNVMFDPSTPLLERLLSF